jgi:hypothetical protein
MGLDANASLCPKGVAKATGIEYLSAEPWRLKCQFSKAAS